MAEKKGKKDVGKLMFKVFLLIVGIYIIIRVIPNSVAMGSRTITVNEELYVNKHRAKGVIIKNEAVHQAHTSGELETHVANGQKVSAGTKIATLMSSKEGSALEEELKQVDKSINELKEAINSMENILGDEGDINLIKSGIQEEIQVAIKENKLEDIYLLKERLNNINNINLDTVEDSNESIVRLENRRQELLDQIDRNVRDYYSEFGGIVSFNIDGFEEKYPPFDFERYNYDYIDLEENTKAEKLNKKNISEGQEIYKLMDNFIWYVAIKIDDLKDIDDIIDSRFLQVSVNNGEGIYGRVMNVNKLRNTGVIVVRLNDNFHEYYDLRFANIDIIKSNDRSYKIPKTASFKKDGKLGVYIKDLKGVVRFRPILVLGEDGNNYYVKSGNGNGELKIGDDTVKTITEFDEIFINPNGVREGKLVN